MFQALSPGSKDKRREKDRLRKAQKRAQQAKNSKSTMKIMVKKSPVPEIVGQPGSKLSKIEEIRKRNIAEREKLFQELKISNMKSVVSKNLR